MPEQTVEPDLSSVLNSARSILHLNDDLLPAYNENFNHVVEITEASATENEKSKTVNRNEMSEWPSNVNTDETTCEEDNVPLVQFVNKWSRLHGHPPL